MAGRKKNARRRRKRKLIVFVVEIAILAVVVTGFCFYNKLDLINRQELDQTKIAAGDISQETEAVFSGYTTIAIFGLDNRETGVYTAGNSDMIMVMNINNDTKEMSLVSLYRDTYLNVASAESDELVFRKCNSAYARGGPEQAITMLNRNLDLEIDHYVSVDFQAVAEAIDILGGVDITIESEEELHWLNDYIQANNGILGEDADLIDSVGEHTLDGVQAVAYARIRYTAGNDFKRAERQRRVFSEMMSKAKEASLSQVNQLIESVFPDIQTDLAKKDILTMASVMLDYDMANSGGFPYDRTTETLGDVGSVVIPCTLESNVVELHRQMFGAADYQPSELVQEYSDYIINRTGMTGEDAYTDKFSDADDFTGSGAEASSTDTPSDTSSEEDGE